MNRQGELGDTSDLLQRLVEHDSSGNIGRTKSGVLWHLLMARCILDRYSAVDIGRQVIRLRLTKRCGGVTEPDVAEVAV